MVEGEEGCGKRNAASKSGGGFLAGPLEKRGKRQTGRGRRERAICAREREYPNRKGRVDDRGRGVDEKRNDNTGGRGGEWLDGWEFLLARCIGDESFKGKEDELKWV